MGAPSVLRRMVVRPRSRRRRRFLQRGLPSSAHGDTGIPGPFGNARVGGGCGPAPPGVRRRGQRRPVRDLRRVTLSAGLSRCGDRTVRSSPAKRSKGQNRCCAPPVAGLCNSNPVCRNKSCMCRAVAGLKTPSDQDLQDCSLFGNFTDTHTQTERKREREEESYRGGINNSNYPAYIYIRAGQSVFLSPATVLQSPATVLQILQVLVRGCFLNPSGRLLGFGSRRQAKTATPPLIDL